MIKCTQIRYINSLPQFSFGREFPKGEGVLAKTKKISFVYIYLKGLVLRDQNLFTELENLILVSSSPMSKLGDFRQFRAKSSKNALNSSFTKHTFSFLSFNFGYQNLVFWS